MRIETAPCVERKQLLEFVQAATLAPSPDNNQPWKFSVGDNRILVLEDTSRRCLSDTRGMFSLAALGAALENICIAARHDGFTPQVTRFPEGGVAHIEFTPGARSDLLYPYLETRATCRAPYEIHPIAENTLHRLQESAPDARLTWIQGRRDIRSAAKLVAAADRIRFESRLFHEELQRQLRITPEEAERTRDGIDLRTLALPPGGGQLLRFIKSWTRARFLNRFGLSRGMSIPSALTVARSGALGVLTISELSPDAILEGGRAFQRIWLTAQAEGLALQPLACLPLFLAKIHQNDVNDFNERHRRQLRRAKRSLRTLAPDLRGHHLLMLFRIGVAKAPEVRSLRRRVNDLLVAEKLTTETPRHRDE